MAPEDAHLARLSEAVTATERQYIAIGIVAAFKALACVEPPTAEELADKDAAEIAWKSASKALADYQQGRQKRRCH